MRRDNAATYREMLTRMAKESGVETPTIDDLVQLDRARQGKKLSNEDSSNWTCEFPASSFSDRFHREAHDVALVARGACAASSNIFASRHSPFRQVRLFGCLQAKGQSPQHLRRHERTRSQGPFLRRRYPASSVIRPCHLAYKPEHAVDLDTGVIVAAPINAADKGDTTTLGPTLEAAEKNLSAVGVAPTPEDPCDLVADKGYYSRDVLKEQDGGPWKTRSLAQARDIYVGMATMRRAPRSMRTATG